MTARKTVTDAASEFGRLLDVVRSRWQKVCVLDFPPRLTLEVEVQQAFREEFCRVAARMGKKNIIYRLQSHISRCECALKMAWYLSVFT
ncbi:unnamed protein product [Knipowitschia caucasica]